VKVLIEIPEGDSPYRTESLWAQKLGPLGYKLDNIPFVAYGYSYQDVVAAQEENDVLIVTDVIARGGHSTYRLFLAEGLDASDQRFENTWQKLADLGCVYEVATQRLLAVDVPPGADIFRVYSLMEAGEAVGLWEFEEANLGHQVGESGST
jgi:hypothetical protein